MKSQKFSKFARKSAQVMGSPKTFAASIALIVVWALSGFFIGFGDSWQLIINTISTISTGLCVLLVQNTQNRDAMAMQLKLNEIIRAIAEARNTAIALEDCENDEPEVMREEFRRMRDEG